MKQNAGMDNIFCFKMHCKEVVKLVCHNNQQSPPGNKKNHNCLLTQQGHETVPKSSPVKASSTSNLVADKTKSLRCLLHL